MHTKLHFRPYNPKQNLLFPQRLDEDIAENDPVRVVDAVIDELRLDNFKKLYKEQGRCPYHPKMMLKVIVYGYMNNLYSCRKIEAALKRDIHYIWLAGYEKPDHNTINRFRHFGKDKVTMDFAFFAIAFNLKKMTRKIAKSANNGRNNPQNGRFLVLFEFLLSENRIFWIKSKNLAA